MELKPDLNKIHYQKAISFDNTEIAFKYLTNKQLKKAYWLFKVINANILVEVGPALTTFALKIGLPITGLLKNTIFKQFCGGENIEQCSPTIELLAKHKVKTILDYSKEGSGTEDSFDETRDEILKTIEKASTSPDKIPFTVFKLTGLARFGLLEKLSKESTLIDIEKYEYQKVVNRVTQICETAFNKNVSIMIDAEESWIQLAIDDIALSMMRKFNKKKAIVFNTYQLYRTDKLNSLKADTLIADAHEFFLGAKLVRGAYMEKERKRAFNYGYKSPIHETKEATDKDYNSALRYCLQHINRVRIVAGTHNEYSCELLTHLMKEKSLHSGSGKIYFSQLLGMSDNLSFNLADAGYQVAKYVPYGPVKSVMPYLFRRAQENTAIAGQASRELYLHAKELKRRGL